MDLDLKIYLHPPVSFADTEILIIIIRTIHAFNIIASELLFLRLKSMYACVGGGAPWASVGRSFRVISGASGGIRGLSGGFPGGSNREGAFVGAVNRTACSSKA